MPPMKPSAEERLRIAMPRTAFPMVCAAVVNEAFRDGFDAARAMLRNPSEELLQKAIFADCRLSGNCKCTEVCRLLGDTDRDNMRAALSAAADAMGEK